MSIPLVQNNEKDSINTSIIAIKRQIERINMLLGLSNSEEIDTSEFATKDELQQAVTDLQPVDEVAVDNMHSVTSNAVASALGTVNDDTYKVDISNQVTKYLGVNIVYAYRKSNKVYLFLSGAYTGSPNTGTNVLVAGIPQKYRPKFEMNGFAMLGYNGSQFVSTARGSIDENGDLKIQESGWANGTQIRSCLIYFVD